MADATELQYLSLADLDTIADEAVGFNPEADANALVPPIPKGQYQLKLYWADGTDPDKRWVKKLSRKEKVFLMTNIVAEVVNDEKWGGRTIMHNPMTLVMENTGTSGVQAILQVCGYGEHLKTVPQTHQAQARLLNEALANEPVVLADVDWRASQYDKASQTETFNLRGMTRFPKDTENKYPDLGYVPVVEADDGEEVFARNYIARFHTLETAVHTQEAPKAPVKAAGASAGGAAPRTAPQPVSRPAPAATKHPAPAPSRRR